MIYNIGAGESQITICEDGQQYRLFVPGERGFFVSMPYIKHNEVGLVMTYPNIPSFFAYLYDINYDEIKNNKNHPFYQLNDYLYDYLYNILSNNYSNKKLDLFPKQITRKYKFEKIKSGI